MPSAPSLSLAWMFTIEVLIGPERHLGRSEAGERIDFPIVGGTFAGPEIHGDVVPGGMDHFLMRPDGIGVLDARYRLRAADGSLIDIHNRGLWVPNEAGLARLRAGGEPTADELYCRCTPQFAAPAGPHDWLNRVVAAGRVEYPRPGLVVVTCFRIL
jgi:hypothetical protein